MARQVPELIDWLFGYDDPILAANRVPGTAALALSQGPASIYSQNVSQQFALPGWSAGVAGGNNPDINAQGNPVIVTPGTVPAGAGSLSPLLIVAAAFVVVYLVVKG